ncbi:MAG: hypothetical protein ACFFDY_01315 [Candidatus Thorarchaeota archaeon]
MTKGYNMKRFIKMLVVLLILCFCIVTTCQAVQLVCIGLETEREGICDIWDIVEIQDDDVDLTGPGYELFEIIHIANMTKIELTTLTDLIQVETARFYNDEGDLVKYWFDENATPPDWYEIHVQPKYKFTVEDFTHEDIVILEDDLATTSEKAEIISKMKDKITLYPQNSLDTVPKQK